MAKLTLNIEPSVIEKIKKVAKKKHISLSKLTADYFEKVASEEERGEPVKKIEEISDFVKSLIVVSEPTPDFDHKQEYGKHLEEKYFK